MGAAMALTPGRAAAEEAPLAGLELAGGPGLTWFAGGRCDSSGDLVACQQSSGFLTFEVVPRWRLVPEWTVGAVGVVGAEPGSEGSRGSDGSSLSTSRRLWRGEAEVAFWPWAGASVRPWIGAGVGALAIETTLRVEGSPALPASPRAGTVAALAFGGGFGVEADVGGGFALGVALRARAARLNTEPRRGTTYDDAPWLAGTLTLAWATPFRAPPAGASPAPQASEPR